MSSHIQNSRTQTNVDGGQVNFEAALRIATVIVEANQRLFKLQSEAASDAVAENSKYLMNSLSTKDSGALLGEWASLYEANTRRVLDVTRSCFEIVPQTQAEIASLMGGPSVFANKETQQYVDQFTKAMSDGRDAAAASVREFLAKAVATTSGVPPLRKKEKVIA
jgi:phasin family protein